MTWSGVETLVNPLRRGATNTSRESIVLKATKEEIEEVQEYFEWQAPDLKVTFLQKVYSEAVLNSRHNVWDPGCRINPVKKRIFGY